MANLISEDFYMTNFNKKFHIFSILILVVCFMLENQYAYVKFCFLNYDNKLV